MPVAFQRAQQHEQAALSGRLRSFLAVRAWKAREEGVDSVVRASLLALLRISPRGTGLCLDLVRLVVLYIPASDDAILRAIATVESIVDTAILHHVTQTVIHESASYCGVVSSRAFDVPDSVSRVLFRTLLPHSQQYCENRLLSSGFHEGFAKCTEIGCGGKVLRFVCCRCFKAQTCGRCGGEMGLLGSPAGCCVLHSSGCQTCKIPLLAPTSPCLAQNKCPPTSLEPFLKHLDVDGRRRAHATSIRRAAIRARIAVSVSLNRTSRTSSITISLKSRHCRSLFRLSN